ncbi:MAG TPA: hypothetical protein VNZ64_27050 [Candidatus Acidoferrum sp.]|jgi:hypothetical protein|nr:hypothetical protein [Candidatus Acidoferrum sp.]
MKLNTPDSPDTFIQSFTDPQEWSAAKWAATAFLYDPGDSSHEPPSLAIAFENFDAGKRIFDGWIERLGHIDTYEELRISVIEGPLPGDPRGYSVFVSSNPLNTVKRKQLDQPDFDPALFIRSGRLNRMNPAPRSPHLRLFKSHFARLGRYLLLPAHFKDSQIQNLDSGRSIEKHELNLFHTTDLKPHQAEYSVFSTPTGD